MRRDIATFLDGLVPEIRREPVFDGDKFPIVGATLRTRDGVVWQRGCFWEAVAMVLDLDEYERRAVAEVLQLAISHLNPSHLERAEYELLNELWSVLEGSDYKGEG